MRAITLHQPYASLVALGVKTIETRSWSTKYSGPLAIHAAKKTVYGPIGDYYAETWYSNVVHDGFRCCCEADGVGPPCTHVADRAPCLTKRERLVTMLPLGAVVATCTLVDVVPIGGPFDFRTGAVEGDEGDYPGRAVVVHHPSMGSFAESLVIDDEDQRVTDVSAQLPYGDFSPGRYAWLMADIKPLAEPIPAKGRQGLWTPDPDLAEAVAAALDATAV